MNAAVTTELRTIGHWIGGQSVGGDSGRKGPVFNPATGEQTGEVAFASTEEMDRAVATATEAYAMWRQWSLSKRAELFFASTSSSTSTATISRDSSPPSTARCSPMHTARCSAESR